MRSNLLSILLIVLACQKPVVPAAPTTPAPAPTPAAASGPRVTFPDGFVVHVELATDDETRAQGLMFRDQLRPGTGMLFFFPRDGEYPFWMKNTIIPLDMIWIDSNRKVAHIAPSVPPCRADPCPSYPPNAVSRYVLEVAGGVAREHGLKAGDVLRFEETDHVLIR
jgi:uncharacterized membrane protein (UPF0127 family)